MKASTMDAACLRALRQRGHTESKIAEMSPEEAFCEYCAYLGIMNLSPVNLQMLDRLRSPQPMPAFFERRPG